MGRHWIMVAIYDRDLAAAVARAIELICDAALDPNGFSWRGVLHGGRPVLFAEELG